LEVIQMRGMMKVVMVDVLIVAAIFVTMACGALLIDLLLPLVFLARAL
jgi:hypothetical protein